MNGRTKRLESTCARVGTLRLKITYQHLRKRDFLLRQRAPSDNGATIAGYRFTGDLDSSRPCERINK
jgi:hypothetical protein